MSFVQARVERAKIVLTLPESASRFGGQHYLPLVVDEGMPAQTLFRGVRFDHAAQVIKYACLDRATGLVDGWLSVAGRRECTPEKYLRDWRCAIDAASTTALAPQCVNLHPFAVFDYDVRAEPGAKSHCTDEPPGGLRAILDRHPARPATADLDGQVGHEFNPNRRLLWIDLTQPDGPRDALWLEIFLTPNRSQPYGMSCSIELPSAQAVQSRAWTPRISSSQANHYDTSSTSSSLAA